MQSCPSCSIDNSDSCKFCSECGAALKLEFVATVIKEADASLEDSVHSSHSDHSHHGRFLPGTKVADRYRIVSLVGKGGMGEVYRADDLKLGHTVALKFLPKGLADDPQRLEYFHSEVRLTRQISHPNVCRVYDIGEVDGQHFLSMEYIDGEDLKILLRRIGRLPEDKGIEIAQQLCTGLGAAHDRGILHRDLKPANIMIDGRGKVRITDFGLAKLADDGAKGEIAGTPAYMAPEQLARGEATIQSDLYSLGLILYELFTGQAVHNTSSIPELMRAHEESSLVQPSNLVDEMDPAVNRIVLHCLEKESHERPKSAHAVAAALPGGDPLAAAMAAGETPSPELVAAAGETGTLSLRTGIACLVSVLVGLIILVRLVPLTPPGRLTGLEPSALDPVRLKFDVQDEILKPLGHYSLETPPDHAIHGLQLRKQSDESHRMEFWYRQRTHGYLTPAISEITEGPRSFVISMSNPPPFDAGMVSVRCDLYGQLIELLAIPVDETSSLVQKPLDRNSTLSHLFEQAGLSFSNYEKLDEPYQQPLNWKPPLYSDEVAIFQPKLGDSLTRVIVAFDNNQLVYFHAAPLFDGRFPDRQFASLSVSSGSPIGEGGGRYRQLLNGIVLLTSIFLTLKNVRLGRADRKGALRFVIWIGSLQMLTWLFARDHVASLQQEWSMFSVFLKEPWLAYIFRHWLYYMALEPYIRRYWPDVLIAWSRAVDGRLRDPLLGQGLLTGCLMGVTIWILCNCVYAVTILSGHFAPLSPTLDPGSPFRLMATMLTVLNRSTSWGVWYLMVLFLVRIVLRNPRFAIIGFMLVYMGVTLLDGSPMVHVLMLGIYSGGVAFVITRFGLIAGIAFIFTQQLMEISLVTPDITTWYGPGTLVALGSIMVVACYGFYTSTLSARR